MLTLSQRSRFRSLCVQVLVVLGSFSCDGPKPIDLPDPVPEDYDVTWSPDGQWLAFEHSEPGELPSVMVARVDGSQRQMIIAGAGMPDWSPDGLSLTFVQARRIGTIVLVTGAITWLSPPGAFSLAPAWSPDGASIVYSSNNGVSTNPPDLWTVPAAGGTPTRVALPGPPRSQTDHADWSPDSRELVATVAGNTARLMITSIDGADTTSLSALGGDATQAAWSPLGDRLAYTRSSPLADVYLVRLDGSDNRLLQANAIRPAWSPDGSRVAFSRRSATDMSIWSVEIATGNLTRLSWAPGQP